MIVYFEEEGERMKSMKKKYCVYIFCINRYVFI